MSQWLICSLALASLALAALWRWARPVAIPIQPQTTPCPTAPLAQPQPLLRPSTAVRTDLVWRTTDQLDEDRRTRLLAGIRNIPRPPHALQRLLEPEFMARASTAELRELVGGEPLVAARVLASINSPIYGLQSPVNDIGQAVTYLGAASVRGLCLQHMLAASFPSRLAGVRKTFHTLWNASALASELAVRLDRMPGLPSAGPLNTPVVLGFVGSLATASLIPPTGLPAWLQREPEARARLEQELLGLSAAEVGHLLMTHWGLPSALVDTVRDAGRLQVVPLPAGTAEPSPRLALAALCARLGERLALGQLASLDGYLVAEDESPDMQPLRMALAHPALAGLDIALQAPELRRSVRQLLAPRTPA
jgi:HD-like signal output (HDOD) protein